MYTDGIGVQQDYREAEKWLSKAAEQGQADAQIIMGRLYREGLGVEQDLTTAYMWLSLAADTEREETRTLAAEKRDGLARKMTPEEIAEGLRLANGWRRASKAQR